MSNVNIKQVSGGEQTNPASTDAIELDDGSASKWAQLKYVWRNGYSNFENALGTFKNILTSATTAARTYTFVNRDASIGNNLNNFSVAAQTPSATRTYLTGSNISVPADKLAIGTMYKCRFDITKTAAGTAATTVDVCIGTNGSTSDTARVSFTIPAGSAAVDTAWIEINVIFRGPLTSSCIAAGHLQATKSSAVGAGVFQATNLPCYNETNVSGTFDMTTANLIIGTCITPGASSAFTIQMVMAEAVNL